MDYDVLILGGGIIGCAAAYELSKYSLNIALIEKDYDIADDIATINTEIAYDGTETNDSIISKLEYMGNGMFEEITGKFNVPFKRKNSLIIASNEKEEKIVNEMYNKAMLMHMKNIRLLKPEEVYEMEPNFNNNVRCALYSKSMGILCPYDLAIAYGEVAFDNGVNFRLEEEVINIEKITRGFRVTTNKNKFTCKVVLNTTPAENFSVDSNVVEKKLEHKKNESGRNVSFFIFEKDIKFPFKSMIFTRDEDGDIIYAVPTFQGNMAVAVNSKNNLEYYEAFKKVSQFVCGVKKENVCLYYQTPYNQNPIFIDDSLIDSGYIRVTGKHYGEVTITPYLGKMICETIVSNLNCKPKKNFNDKRREFYRFRDLNKYEIDKLVSVNKSYGKIVCVCQKISEGEIIDAIRRPLGARTVEGVKRRTGVTMGNCQGAYCINKIATILARETNKSITEIVKDSNNSKIVAGRIKEFDEM